ncbi:collagen binding domain-containing protein [Streptomyces sp. NPDC051561]|uniref:collagen binding domain-containing protein n=1 Tax=Streptomyces sp. NPDC051561 TaxID=3365658 RepID=UPI0037890D14
MSPRAVHVRRVLLLTALTCASSLLGPLALAPTAAAQVPEPTPATPAPRSMPETGGVQLSKKDPEGTVMAGAKFTLLTTAGKGVATGTTDANGRLTFDALAPGVYRLKETASGSPLHDVVADQDVIVTPALTPLTIVDPFKPTELTIKKTDKATGKPLAGATINVTPKGGGDTVTLTTSANGTAHVKLPAITRAGTAYTATETKAPTGFELDRTPVPFTAVPGKPVTVTLTNTRTPTTPPPTSPAPTTPSGKPTPTAPSATKTPSSPPPTTPAVKVTTPTTAPPPDGALAQTGAGISPWLLGGAGLLLAAGGGALIAARRRQHTHDQTDESSQD